MNTRSHAVLVSVMMSLAATVGRGQPESILALETSKQGRSPFRKGDQLEIQCDAAIAASPAALRITVLDISNWPWIVVDSERGEMWLNFSHVVTAKNTAPAK